ncbi:MAG: type II toxin-antitoxin system VapC family toxin [Pseudomonadota bacterium]
MVTEPEFLLDANVCIYVIEGLAPALRERIEDSSIGALATSAIAYAEVMRGVDMSNPAANAVAAAFFDICVVLPFDARAALAFRRVPFRRGRFDHLIAAHALALNLTLVTANDRDFADIPGLRVENWTL